jgi:hypothetical protein
MRSIRLLPDLARGVSNTDFSELIRARLRAALARHPELISGG